MSTVLTIYNQQSFCRQLLPSDNNVDYYFTLAGSSHEAVNNILAKKGFSGGKMDAAGNAG